MNNVWYINGEHLSHEQMHSRQAMITTLLAWGKEKYGCCNGGQWINKVANANMATLASLMEKINERKR